MLSMSSPNRLYATVVGAVLVLVGILGLILNTTGGNLLGLFAVDLLHNLVHLVSGIIAIALAYLGMARVFNRAFGIVYTLLAVVGLALFTNGPSLLGIINLNLYDNLLHLVLGVSALAVGFLLSDAVVTARV